MRRTEEVWREEERRKQGGRGLQGEYKWPLIMESWFESLGSCSRSGSKVTRRLCLISWNWERVGLPSRPERFC